LPKSAFKRKAIPLKWLDLLYSCLQYEKGIAEAARAAVKNSKPVRMNAYKGGNNTNPGKKRSAFWLDNKFFGR
jgi:hypothetical protein